MDYILQIEKGHQRFVEAWAQLEGILPKHVRNSISTQVQHRKPTGQTNHNNHKNAGHIKSNNNSRPPVPRTPTDSSAVCTACGRTGHTTTQCRLSDHPDANKENGPWANSAKGKAWAAKNRSTLPFTETLSGAAYQPPMAPKTGTSYNNSGNNKRQRTSKYTQCLECMPRGRKQISSFACSNRVVTACLDICTRVVAMYLITSSAHCTPTQTG